jgi:hypothetical protein
MRIVASVEQEIRRVIRDERAKDPLIIVSGLEHHRLGGKSRAFAPEVDFHDRSREAKQTRWDDIILVIAAHSYPRSAREMDARTHFTPDHRI